MAKKMCIRDRDIDGAEVPSDMAGAGAADEVQDLQPQVDRLSLQVQ